MLHLSYCRNLSNGGVLYLLEANSAVVGCCKGFQETMLCLWAAASDFPAIIVGFVVPVLLPGHIFVNCDGRVYSYTILDVCSRGISTQARTTDRLVYGATRDPLWLAFVSGRLGRLAS